MKPLDMTKGAAPLYSQIYASIKEDIEKGEYREGDNIPTEMELQEQYGVSRITVRQAVLALEQEGLLLRIRGKGTIVTGKPIFKENLNQIKSFTDEMLDRGMTPGSQNVTIELVPAGPELAAVFSCEETKEIYHLSRVRTGNGKPLVLFETWLCLSVPIPLDSEAYRESVYALLKKSGAESPVSVEDQFEAVIADETVRKALSLSKGAPVMKRIRKGTNRKGSVQEYTIGYYDSRNYSYVIHLENHG